VSGFWASAVPCASTHCLLTSSYVLTKSRLSHRRVYFPPDVPASLAGASTVSGVSFDRLLGCANFMLHSDVALTPNTSKVPYQRHRVVQSLLHRKAAEPKLGEKFVGQRVAQCCQHQIALPMRSCASSLLGLDVSHSLLNHAAERTEVDIGLSSDVHALCRSDSAAV
jgi:hypothetical protein